MNRTEEQCNAFKSELKPLEPEGEFQGVGEDGKGSVTGLWPSLPYSNPLLGLKARLFGSTPAK